MVVIEIPTRKGLDLTALALLLGEIVMHNRELIEVVKTGIENGLVEIEQPILKNWLLNLPENSARIKAENAIIALIRQLEDIIRSEQT